MISSLTEKTVVLKEVMAHPFALSSFLEIPSPTFITKMDRKREMVLNDSAGKRNGACDQEKETGQLFASWTLQWWSLDVAFIGDSEVGHAQHIWS